MSFLNKLTQSRKTILEMMQLRDYDIEKYNNYSSKELDIMLKNMDKKLNYNNMPLDMIFDHSTSDKQCILKYIISRVRVSNLKTLITELIETVFAPAPPIKGLLSESIKFSPWGVCKFP